MALAAAKQRTRTSAADRTARHCRKPFTLPARCAAYIALPGAGTVAAKGEALDLADKLHRTLSGLPPPRRSPASQGRGHPGVPHCIDYLFFPGPPGLACDAANGDTGTPAFGFGCLGFFCSLLLLS